MITAEREIEDLARTVECPICHAKPLRKCSYSVLGKKPFSQEFSHAGRLIAARCRP